jgi:hypothetical protein
VRLLFIGSDIFDGGTRSEDYPFEDDEEQEWDALINIMYDTAQYFVSQYDFSVVNDQDDEGSPGAQP